MASEEMRKKWGTIFMGEREASVEQLNAMQEHLNRDKIQKEQTEDYMERVRARATDRAREILGAAYTERQKVLDEVKGEAAVQKRLAVQECAKIKAEGEEIRKKAQEELAKAQAEREEAERIREAAHGDGYQDGMNQAGAELHQFRAELGQSLSTLLRALERERHAILETWRQELVELVQAAAQSGTGLLLRQEHNAILERLVFQSLDLLEKRSVISLKVNPADEEVVSDMFRAARERAPELKQWTVIGDDTIEPGGLVMDSGSGSVDFRRSNFREMVDSILGHLALPDRDLDGAADREVASLVEQEVAHIASLTPELDQPGQEEAAEVSPGEPASTESPEREAQAPQIEQPVRQTQQIAEPEAADPSLAELEEELFPLEGEQTPVEEPELNDDDILPDVEPPLEGPLPASAPTQNAQAASQPASNPTPQPADQAAPAQVSPPDSVVEPVPDAGPELDAKTLAEGGFL